MVSLKRLKQVYYNYKFKLQGKIKCPYCGDKVHKDSYYHYYGNSGVHFYCFRCLMSICEANDAFFRPYLYEHFKYENLDDIFSRFNNKIGLDIKLIRRKYLLKKILNETK